MCVCMLVSACRMDTDWMLSVVWPCLFCHAVHCLIVLGGFVVVASMEKCAHKLFHQRIVVYTCVRQRPDHEYGQSKLPVQVDDSVGQKLHDGKCDLSSSMSMLQEVSATSWSVINCGIERVVQIDSRRISPISIRWREHMSSWNWMPHGFGFSSVGFSMPSAFTMSCSPNWHRTNRAVIV